MTVPKQRRGKTARRNRRGQYAITLKNLSGNGAQGHRISADNPVYKGRDYSDVFAKTDADA